MARKDLSHRDASDHAASELDSILRSVRPEAGQVPTMTPEEAMTHARVFKAQSNRDVTRVLFISRNTALLNPTTQSLDGYIDISQLFDEVHIVILRTGIPPRYPVLRAAPNVWLYTVSAKFWWWTPHNALKMIERELVFANGFRPDLVVARDPFESALVAAKVGEKYNRVTQLHVLEDYSTADFLKRSRHNFWRRFMPHFTVPRFQSVRTLTSSVQTMLQKRFTVADIGVLPRFQNYEALIDTDARIDLKTQYKPVSISLLYIGKLDHESTCYRAIDAARFVLKNPRVGLIVLGDGNARSEFTKRAKTQGIERQVIFEPRVSDPVPYLKSATILIVTDTDADSEEVVLKGAAAGIPMIMARTETREDIFHHGVSALLCDATDIQAFTDALDRLLNDPALRERFAAAGQQMIRRRFHNDPKQYQESYRASIEEAFFVGDEDTREAKE